MSIHLSMRKVTVVSALTPTVSTIVSYSNPRVTVTSVGPSGTQRTDCPPGVEVPRRCAASMAVWHQ